jgi:hypothetical protein
MHDRSLHFTAARATTEHATSMTVSSRDPERRPERAGQAADAGQAGDRGRARAGQPSSGALRWSGVVLLVLAVVGAVVFVAARDRLPYPLQPAPGDGARSSATAGLVAVGSPTPTFTRPPILGSFRPGSLASASPAPSEPESTPTPSPTPTPTPKPTSRPQPTTPPSDRYTVLRRCPDASGCWIYVVRAGDNLFSIANWFGVSLSTVRAWNPWTRSGLDPGRELRIPTPTR